MRCVNYINLKTCNAHFMKAFNLPKILATFKCLLELCQGSCQLGKKLIFYITHS